MFELKIEDKLLEKLERLFKDSPALAEESIKLSIKKAVNLVKNMEKTHMTEKYTADSTVVSSKFLRSKYSSTSAEVLGSTKRNNIENFEVSMKKPGKSIEKLKAGVIRKNGLSTMKTMFWAFYKSHGKSGKLTSAGLYIRNGEERYKISKVKTVSVKQMGITELTEEQMEKIQMVFYKELDKKISEVLR